MFRVKQERKGIQRMLHIQRISLAQIYGLFFSPSLVKAVGFSKNFKLATKINTEQKN